MKKNILLIISLLFSITCVAQRVEVSNLASVDAPVNMKKIEKNQALNIAKNKFSKRPDLQRAVNGHIDNIYKFDNVIVEINVVERPSPQLNGMTFMKGLLGQLGPTTVENVGDKQLLVTLHDDKQNSIMIYRFFCLNKAATMQAVGFVQFEPTDQQKAKTILYNLIKSLKFKE